MIEANMQGHGSSRVRAPAFVYGGRVPAAGGRTICFAAQGILRIRPAENDAGESAELKPEAGGVTSRRAEGLLLNRAEGSQPEKAQS